MQNLLINLEEKKLVGISVRTNNSFEVIPETGKIGPLIVEFHGQQIASALQGRKTPGVMYCVYTKYESEEHGDYTYFAGEEVESFEVQSTELNQVVIPAQKYVKFTVGPGPMPDICINVWQQIWQMNARDLGGRRSYKTDFEVYDSRASNPDNTEFDLYIGVE